MYPTTRVQEAAPSFPGINFQARPVVGAAQQNIMNLVPVQMKLVPTTNPTLNRAATDNFSPFVLTQIPILSPLSSSVTQPSRTNLGTNFLNEVNLDQNSPDKHFLQKSETSPGHLPAVSLANVDKGGGPILVKKRTQTVPESQLLLPIITPSFYSAPGLSVVHTPPFKLGNQAPTQTNSSVPPLDQSLQNTTSKTLYATPSARLEPNLEQTPKKPSSLDGKRVEDAPPSSTITSEILQTMAQREGVCKQPDAINATVCTLRNSRQGEEGALVLCNGKVFKKNSLMFYMIKSNSASQFHTTKVPSVQYTDSATPQTKPVHRCVIPRHSHKVISLCEDDSLSDKPQKAASQLTCPDGDKVLFMSYIPPKSESGTSEDLIPKTERVPVKEAEQTGTVGDTVGGRKHHNSIINPGVNPSRVSGATGVNVNDNEESEAGSQQSPNIQQVKLGDADLKQGPEDTSVFNSSSSRSTADMDSLKTKSSVDLTSSSCLDAESHLRSDDLLRQMFGISADVRVSLQRIDPWCHPAELQHDGFHQETTCRVGEELPSVDPYGRFVSVTSEEEQDPHRRSVSVTSEEEQDPHRRSVSVMSEQEQDPHRRSVSVTSEQEQDTHSRSVCVTSEQEQDPHRRSVSVTSEEEQDPHRRSVSVTSEQEQDPHRRSVSVTSEQEQDTHSRSVCVTSEQEQDPHRRSVSVTSEQEQDTSPHTCDKALKCSLEDYMVPIEDEDFLEKQVIPTGQLRIRRTMKRIICPCCSPGTEIKALTTGQTRRKGGRARKHRRSPEKSGSQTAKKNSSDAPDSDGFCQTWSEDFEKRSYEEISRLKKLLKEREAALELIRKAAVETKN